MKIDGRAAGTHICGYVNVTEKKSSPVPTKQGTVIETIVPRAFQRAIDRVQDIRPTVDHSGHLCKHGAGTLELYKDDIGLYAACNVSDTGLIKAAQDGKISG